jgi:hypothetical protein
MVKVNFSRCSFEKEPSEVCEDINRISPQKPANVNAVCTVWHIYMIVSRQQMFVVFQVMTGLVGECQHTGSSLRYPPARLWGVKETRRLQSVFLSYGRRENVYYARTSQRHEQNTLPYGIHDVLSAPSK